MRRKTFIVLGVLVSIAVLQGCETMRGVARDIDNTANNVGKLWTETKQADSDFEKRYW